MVFHLNYVYLTICIVGAFAFGRCSSTSEDSGFIIPSLVGAAMSGAFSAIYSKLFNPFIIILVIIDYVI